MDSHYKNIHITGLAAMLKEAYNELIDEAIVHISENEDYLSHLLTQVTGDKELSEDDKKELTIAITLKNSELLGANGVSGGKFTPDSPFPSYKFLDEDVSELPCGLASHNRDKYGHYSHWLRDEFLPTFHPLPRGDLQYPVIACLMLLNSQAMSAVQRLLLVYIQGLSGCGKTFLLESFGYHYPERFIIRAGMSITGAGLRDELDRKVGSGLPGILLWDNFSVRDCMEKLKDHRDLLLMNNKQTAVSHLSTRGDNSQREFKTHCLKVISSIDDGKEGATDYGMGELTRRLWIITCKDTGERPPSRDGYNWQGMIEAYDRIWGHSNKEAIQSEYAKYLKAVSRYPRSKIPFDSKIWDILIVPLAVWQFVGLGTLEEGIEAFRKHREWTYAIDTAQTDILLQAIRDYMIEFRRWVKANIDPSNPLATEERLSQRIDPAKLKEHIEGVLDNYSVTTRIMDEKIAPIMTTFGYLRKIINNKEVFMKL